VANLAGTRIDKYEMIEEVGCGGMAVVYRGRDQVLEREVAVKVLHPHLADRQESRLRLQREAIAVAKLRHENILEIFDYSGPDAVESYIVTEFIHGPTLKEWVDDELQPRPAIAALVIHRLSLALAHAHGQAIVHRDIKPENVMIRRNDGVLKLMDFGIAQIIDNQKLTLTGQLIGSPAYMAPELISGKPLDARTDLFSLGILLYQLATGELPFSGRNPHEVLNRIADGEYPAPSTICPLVDRDLEAIIAKALAVNPDDRYQSVQTLAKELEEYCLETGIEPSQDELSRYFTDPQQYVVDLDIRVCQSLMARASDAAKNGSNARAIRMLGRVLELDSEHKGAHDLLRRLRVRERRVRQLLLAGGALAIAGLSAAGWMLLRPGPDGPRFAHDGLAPPAPTSPIRAATADEATTTGPTADEGGSGGPGPELRESSETGAAAAETGETTAETGETTATVGITPRIRRPPTRVSPETDCRIRLVGIPLSTAKNLERITAAGQTLHVSDSLEFTVSFPDEAARVDIKDKRFHGTRALTAKECTAGVVDVQVRPNAASITFTGGVPEETAVICNSGCSKEAIGVAQTVKTFRNIRMDDDIERKIRLTFKHDLYDELQQSYDVLPGPNTLPVKLKPRGQ
jgi:serine/threonine-protein kinase